MENKIVCVVGMPGAGKSLVSDELVKQGFSYIRFGQITLDKIRELGLAITEANEKKIREDLRKKHGMAAFAVLNIPKIDQLLEKFHVVVDGLYSWSEYKLLREKYRENMYVLAVYAPPKLRSKRLKDRKLKQEDKNQRFRPLEEKETRARDYAEIENLEKGGPIAMADFTIVNTGTINQLKKQVKEIIGNVICD